MIWAVVALWVAAIPAVLFIDRAVYRWALRNPVDEVATGIFRAFLRRGFLEWKMCVADRIGITWGIFVYAALALIGAFSSELPPDVREHGIEQVFLVFVLPVWGTLRLIDLACGGPFRRLARWRDNLNRSGGF